MIKSGILSVWHGFHPILMDHQNEDWLRIDIGFLKLRSIKLINQYCQPSPIKYRVDMH